MNSVSQLFGLKNFIRGYGYQGGASRSDASELVAELKYGPKLSEAILKPGQWNVNLLAFGETLPDHSMVYKLCEHTCSYRKPPCF